MHWSIPVPDFLNKLLFKRTFLMGSGNPHWLLIETFDIIIFARQGYKANSNCQSKYNSYLVVYVFTKIYMSLLTFHRITNCQVQETTYL